MKKIILILFLIILQYNFSFGDETKKNSISLGTNFTFMFSLESPGISYMPPGLNFNYERLLGNKFSIGVEAGSLYSFVYPFVEIQGRFYPWAGMFFTELGFGGLISLIELNVNNEDKASLAIPYIFLEIGWKINIGNKNKWYLLPSIKEMLILVDPVGFFTNLCFKIGYNF